MGHLPKGLLGAALLFWGYQTRLLAVAVPLALVLELTRFSRVRWDFTTADYQRLWNGCLVLLLSAVVFAVGYSRTLLESSASSMPGDKTWNETMPLATRWALLFFQWQPLVFAPFVIAVAFGHQSTLPATVFSWLTRRQTKRVASSRLAEPPKQIAIDPLYFALILIATSTTNRRGWFFFSGLALLIGWALWSHRSKRLPAWGWITTFLLVTSLGFGGQLGLNYLQRVLVGLEATWLQRFAQSRTDPLESRTSIGSIGRLKLSGKIVLRVYTTNDLPPELLREASYDTFNFLSWTVGESNRSASLEWKPVAATPSMSGWHLVTDPTIQERSQVQIARFLRGGWGLLALPMGTTRLENLPASMCSRNSFGGVRVKEAPGLINFNAFYTMGSTFDRPAGPRDLVVTPSERQVILELAKELGLQEKAAVHHKEAMRSIYSYFRNRFRYSVYNDAPPPKASDLSPLARFLTVQRSGHCEYFATATVLLLRAAGINARYAVGYSVQESAGTGHYLVRERHAHAWSMVWSDETQSWADFDTTPPAWNQIESEHASAWEALSDFGSRLWFEYAQWKAGRSELSRYAVYVLTAIFAAFVLRVFLKTRYRSKKRPATGEFLAIERRGEDSEFYLIEANLKRRGLGRCEEETALAWLRRIAPHLGAHAENLPSILRLHYRLRFDPCGLSQIERDRLRTLVQGWLVPPHR